MTDFEQWGRLGNDECARNARDAANRTMQDYSLFVQYNQPADPACPVNRVRGPEKMLAYPNLHSKVGFGTPDACAVDIDPTIKLTKEGLTRQRCRQQLFTRVFQAVPNLRPGNPDAAQESKLLQGVSTSTLECGTLPARRELTEKAYDIFVPLVAPVKDTIQNPNNLVEPWVRGGQDTREFIHTDAFKKMCRTGYT